MFGPASAKEKKENLSLNQFELGKTYYHDTSVENNCEKAFKFISRSAEQGNAGAQFMLGNLYALGHGTEKNHEKAYVWYTKSAIQGYKKALIRIHNLYQEDVAVHCRGQLNSEEDEWNTDEFKKANNVRELNEYRLKLMKPLLNGAMDYYTNQFKKHQSAKEDDPEAQQTLGFLYQHGYGVKKITRWAIECYTIAAEQGFIDAQYNLACLYQKNTDIKFNYRKAFHWYSKAAEGGNIAAQNRLAYFYEKGLAGDINNQLALFWYTKAAASGSSEAQLTLGKIFRKRHNNSENRSAAIKWYCMAAQQGNYVAQNCLFQLNRNGETSHFKRDDSMSMYSTNSSVNRRLSSKLHVDVEKINKSSGIARLKKLAQHALVGDGNAMYQIGLKYYNGVDFDQDREIAFRWIKKSARAGLKESQLMMADMYESGDTVEKNYHKTSLWIKVGSQKQDDEFQCILGILYNKGRGVRQDYLEASKWFTLSADRGNSMAQFQLGLLLYFGSGLNENRGQAAKWFYDSARHGDVAVLYKLGKMKFYGGNDEEKHLAMRMLNYAARHGSTDAKLQLGKKYHEEIHAHLDLSRPNSYYRLIANLSSGRSQYKLAIEYLKGNLFHVDYLESFRLFKLAAERGFPKAKLLLGFPMLAHSEMLENTLIIEMFISVILYDIAPMEFNVGFFYEISKHYSNAFRWYSEAIKKGDGRAFYRLGIMHEEGKGTERNLDEALNYFEKAFKKKETGATYRLACMYLDGRGVKQDLLRAFELYTEASIGDHNESRKVLMLSTNDRNKNNSVFNYGQEESVRIDTRNQINMLETVAKLNHIAVQYRLSLFYEKNGDLRAASWISYLSNKKMIDASYRLGSLYEEGRGVPQNYAKAIDMYQKAIEGNHENATYKLAKLYYYGKGVELDFLKAYNLYNKASKLGHTLSSNILDINQISFIGSSGKIKNYSPEKVARILKMYKLAADNGHVDLYYKLGFFYESNEAYRDYDESFLWYTKASGHGHSDAIYHLGQLYERGLGVEQSYMKSVELYQQAKELGSIGALFKVGSAYHHGYGVKRNSETAVYYYSEAAKSGQTESQFMLGKLYETGELVGKDLLEAVKWYTRASLNGHTKSTMRLYEMYDHKPYEHYFYERLFRILSVLETSRKSKEKKYHEFYGSMLYRLGQLYLNGKGAPKSVEKAFKCFSDSCYIYNYSSAEPFSSLDQGYVTDECFFLDKLECYWRIRKELNAFHQYFLGIYYYEEACRLALLENRSQRDTVMSNNSVQISRAKEYLTLSANQSHKKAQAQLVNIYLDNQLVHEDLDRVLKLHQDFAELTKPHECYIRGMDYFNGNDVNQDYATSLIYLNKAAKGGDYNAKIQIGDMYRCGLGLTLDYKKALAWYESSTQNMTVFDCYRIGQKYGALKDLKKSDEISFLYFRKAADKDDNKAQVKLADMYLKGEGVTYNYNEAVTWFKKSTKEMSGEDCFKQGERFYKGSGVDIDFEISRMFFQKAADKGNVNGDYRLGEIFFEGHGLNNSDYSKAFRHYSKAADKGVTGAQSKLAYMYLKGYGAMQNFDIALKWYKLSAKRMTADESFNHGEKLFYDKSIVQNYEISFIYMKASAEKGNTEAAYTLAKMYLVGIGVEKDEGEARRWFQICTTKANMTECYGLGNKYYTGEGVEENHRVSLIYFKEAAQKGHCEAQIKVGDMYLQGDGTVLDYQKALFWYQKSTETLNDARCYSLGIMHLSNCSGIPIHQKVSFMYFKAASEKGNNDANAKLGYMYLVGRGVEKDLQKSFDHYKKALDNGDISIQKHIYLLYSMGVGMGPNDEEVMNYHKKHVKKMNAAKQYQEGRRFYFGDGVTINIELARLYFTEAADNKYHKAYTRLGEMYSKDGDIKLNHDTARYWFTLSAKGKSSDDCYSKAKKYHETQIGHKNYIASFVYCKKAAESGIVEAQTMLGDMYRKGLGTPKNNENAFEWYQKSARGMDQKDCYEYGRLLNQNGDSVNLLKEVALIYLKESAKSGYYKAQAELGDIYLRGQGVEPDIEKAIDLYKRCVKDMESEESYERGERAYDDIEQCIGYEISLIFLEGAASKGNVKAHIMLGERYLGDSGSKKHYTKAFYHFCFAANNGHQEAQARLGDMYLQGEGTIPNYTKAKEWYETSTKNMSSHDCYLRGIMFFDGSAIQRDYHIARIFFQSAAEKGNIHAHTKIGYMYFNGLGLKQDYALSFNSYQKAAIEGVTEAQIQLANMYSKGIGVHKDIDKALDWCEVSTKIMTANDCYKQAIYLVTGSKSNKNDDLALFYVMVAAEKGNRSAQATLNRLFNAHIVTHPLESLPIEAHKLATAEMNAHTCYIEGIKFSEGNGVTINHQIALVYFRKAAERGYRMACIKLGDVYLQGLGVISDSNEALKWYRISALEMSSSECYTFGEKFRKSVGTKVNHEVSFVYFREAAAKGYHKAYNMIGEMYLKGRGVEIDNDAALYYYSKAAENGDLDAKIKVLSIKELLANHNLDLKQDNTN